MKKLAFEKIFRRLGIKKNDVIFVSSNLLKLSIRKKNNEINFEIKDIINGLIKILENSGTIIIPTFNWDFCKGLGFHYINTPSNSGSLGNYALGHGDFLRTQNPIYSFCVYGKGKNFLTKLEHKSCFELNSPFGYMVKKNAKNLYIDIENIYKDSFTLCHVAEQEIGVDYRFLKKFNGKYVNKNITKKKATYSMYVRKLNLKIKTGVNPKIKTKLIKKKSYIEKNINKINFKIVKMKEAYNIMKQSIINNGDIIFKQKL